jgi:hypothetical protein
LYVFIFASFYCDGLFQALPFLMQSLIEPELAKMNQLLQEHPHLQEQFPDGFQDPCNKYAAILEQFASWYFLARQRKHTESSILKVAQDGERLQTSLKEVFPNRAGTIQFDFRFLCFYFVCK